VPDDDGTDTDDADNNPDTDTDTDHADDHDNDDVDTDNADAAAATKVPPCLRATPSTARPPG
jgi:hypothetical protein